MFYFIKYSIILFITLYLVSCADQDKMTVTGAKVSSSETISADEEKSSANSDEMLITDDESNLINNEESVLVKKLLEVGDRVFFDYDQSSWFGFC